MRPSRRARQRRKPGAIVKDFHGAYLFAAPPHIAHIAVTAVNAWTKLFGDCTVYRDVLRALQAQLMPMRAMPAVKRALELIETTLNPEQS